MIVWATLLVVTPGIAGCSAPIDVATGGTGSAQATATAGRRVDHDARRSSERLPNVSWHLANDPRSSPTVGCADLHADGAVPRIVDVRLSRASTPLCFRAFAILHSGITRTPLYVAEHLTRGSVAQARLLDTRDNRFHPEPRLIPTERAELVDYRASGYDRGHMAPSGDMGDGDDDFESFSLANIVPQNRSLNRSGWAAVEDYVRDLTDRAGQAYVVTGPAFAGARINRLGGRVLVPSHVWKAVYVPGKGAGAWIVSNDAEQRWETVSVAELTDRVGIDPFPRMAAATRTATSAFPTFHQ